MNKCVMMLGVGLMVGAYLGYSNGDEIEEMAHIMHRQAHRAYRKVCDCMEH